ncbi:MAG TPA: hypothetical protein VFP65_10350, partial [Anaeromyxobacteraceae bacterium]|nr:hypothetical protein [Anaeromyxobacteraceae bacterium]
AKPYMGSVLANGDYDTLHDQLVEHPIAGLYSATQQPRVDELRARYDEDIAWVDHEVGGFLDWLDMGLFDRRDPYPAMGPTAARPAAEDALLVTVAGLAELGLQAPLLAWIDVRELLWLPELADAAHIEAVKRRAAEVGLARALHGACALVAHFYPEVAAQAGAMDPALGRAERVAVEAVVESAKDPAKLRLARGVEAASRAVVAP